MMKMKAAVLVELKKSLQVLNVQDPGLTPDGVIIRVEAEGICRSDWHAWNGDFGWCGLNIELPHVMGHEFCGIVEEVGKDVRHFKMGDRVIVPFCQGDGTCNLCQSGHSNVCENQLQAGFDYWGGYGRYVHIPRADHNLVHLPENISFTTGAGLGCRFMTAFHGITGRAKVKPGEWVAVHGCGGIGLSAIHIASSMGANVIAVDIKDESLALAKEMGAAYTLNGKITDAVGEIQEMTKGGAHVAVDALGLPATCLNSFNSLKKTGRHLQIGLTTSGDGDGYVSIPIDVMIQKEITILGSLGMPSFRFPYMLQMIESGKLDPGKLVTRTVSIDEASSALESMTHFNTVGVTVIDRW
jgi:D-arabinose 1-dehydrogenase-like Zn-dependent alcohol dehydrogenase